MRARVGGLAASLASLVLGCIPPSGGAPGSTNVAPRGAGGGAGAVADEREPPTGRLPEDVRPLHYRLALRIVPSRERFEGRATIRVRLEQPRTVLWMHGRELDVTSAVARGREGKPLEATWDPVRTPEADGLVALRLPEPIGPGEVTLSFEWSAAFDEQLKGLYRVRTGGDAYAFTQFEATWARGAFPCFDEPAFKTPFDVTLEVRAQDEALGNTPVVEREATGDDLERVRLAPTEPLPTYLVAWAVGPLDVVEAEAIPPNGVRDRPVPLRGVATRGQGGQLERALAETPAMLASLERYLGLPYPYEKLDIVAVPDFASGAMENVGLVTFRETLLLLGDDPPERQQRAFAHVMAHELAHMWFGNLVTMPWWDDLWLNEAFATWLGHRTVADVYPAYHARLGLVSQVQRAMRSDSLASARRIREPIETSHDIRNAFDAITYQKGAGVLRMFERWLGEGTFRRGLRRYLREDAHGTATTGGLLEALSAESGRDVETPFRTFLEQEGVPFVSVERSCVDGGTKLSLAQSRYLPVGSKAERDMRWQVPVCVRVGVGEGRVDDYCVLLTEKTQDVLLEGRQCADWVMPNADGAGYYRFALEGDGLDRLMDGGWGELGPLEKRALAGSLAAGFASARLDVPTVFGTLERLARSGVRPVAQVPMRLVKLAHDHLVPDGERPRVARFGRRLYGPVWRRLGWRPGADESGEDRLLRARVLEFLALEMEDPAIRRQAERRAHRYLGWDAKRVIDRDAVSGDLVPAVLEVAAQEGDRALFDHMVKTAFEVSDSLLRGRLLSAVFHATDPQLAEQARALALDPRLRVNEVLDPLRAQLAMPETREAAWEWLTAHYDALVERLATTRAGSLPWLASSMCSEDDAERVRSFFEGRVEELPGGPRNLAGALEAIRLCAARVEAHRDAAQKLY